MSQRYLPKFSAFILLNHVQSIRQPASLRDRSNLLGVTPPSSGRSSPFSSSYTASNGQRYADDLESQNDEALEGLSAKVKLLKEISIGIGNEVRESAVQLSNMNDAFAETSGILQGTFRRMNNMADRHGCRWLWYIVFLIVVFWFFIIVWWFRR
ncbi:Protein transport protein bet1 [Termitomyces sp. J132]|nr:Protein transport protein bet1 [Termitomyces sp. J132]